LDSKIHTLWEYGKPKKERKGGWVWAWGEVPALERGRYKAMAAMWGDTGGRL
jgi:hypothetical protein